MAKAIKHLQGMTSGVDPLLASCIMDRHNLCWEQSDLIPAARLRIRQKILQGRTK